MITVDTILDYLKESVEQKRALDSHTWVDAALKLNVLVGDEHDKLFELQQVVSKKKVELLESDSKRNVSAVKVLIEASDDYKYMKKQDARINQIEEFIRIAKLQARLKDNEYGNYG